MGVIFKNFRYRYKAVLCPEHFDTFSSKLAKICGSHGQINCFGQGGGGSVGALEKKLLKYLISHLIFVLVPIYFRESYFQ